MNTAMLGLEELTLEELEELEGSGFWPGVFCGLSLGAAAAALLSPEPLSKAAVVAYLATGPCLI